MNKISKFFAFILIWIAILGVREITAQTRMPGLDGETFVCLEHDTITIWAPDSLIQIEEVKGSGLISFPGYLNLAESTRAYCEIEFESGYRTSETWYSFDSSISEILKWEKGCRHGEEYQLREGKLVLEGIYKSCGKSGVWREYGPELEGLGQFLPKQGIWGYEVTEYVYDSLFDAHLEIIMTTFSGAVHHGPWQYFNSTGDEVGQILFDDGVILSRSGKVPHSYRYMISEEDD